MNEQILADSIENDSAIKEILNSEYCDSINDSEIVICGITFQVTGEVYLTEETEVLYSENLRFERRGKKVFSYERWVDTNWYDWE